MTEGVWLGLHLNLLLLSVCEEGEGPAGVHLHCQVIILHQVDQGRQGLEGDQMSEHTEMLTRSDQLISRNEKINIS